MWPVVKFIKTENAKKDLTTLFVRFVRLKISSYRALSIKLYNKLIDSFIDSVFHDYRFFRVFVSYGTYYS